MSEEEQDRLFQEKPVDVSRKYAAMLFVVTVGIAIAAHVAGPTLAVKAAMAALLTVALSLALPAGPTLIHWREKRD